MSHRFDRLGFVIDKCHESFTAQLDALECLGWIVHPDWYRIDGLSLFSAELRRLHRGLSTAKKRSLEKEALLIRHRQREMNRLDQLPESAPSLRCQRVILRPWRSQDEYIHKPISDN